MTVKLITCGRPVLLSGSIMNAGTGPGILTVSRVMKYLWGGGLSLWQILLTR